MSDPTINERFIKFSSRIPFPNNIALGQDMTVLVEGKQYIFNCVTTQDKDLQDGTIDRIYTLKSLTE